MLIPANLLQRAVEQMPEIEIDLTVETVKAIIYELNERGQYGLANELGNYLWMAIYGNDQTDQ